MSFFTYSVELLVLSESVVCLHMATVIVSNIHIQGKLEDYKAKQKKGEALNEEQLKAVSKLDDVLSQIELLQDLIKQFTSYNTEVCTLLVVFLL